MKKPIILGNIEILPRTEEYSSYPEFSKKYPGKGEAKKGDIRRTDWRETKFLLTEYKKLGILGYLKKYYYYEFIVSIEVLLYDSAWGYNSVFIEEEEEVEKYLNNIDCVGIDKSGEEVEIYPESGRIVDEKKNEGVYFLCKEI